MKHSISVPKNAIEITAIAAFALVVLASLGFHGIWPGWVIPVLGVFIGIFGIGEPKQFLLAGLALLAAKWGLNYVPFIGEFAKDFTVELTRLVAPAMLVVSVKSIYYQMKK